MPTVVSLSKLRKPTECVRDWPEYNSWQNDEVILTLTRLRTLVETSVVHDWSHKMGRPRVGRRVIVLCLLVKAFCNVSYRRLHGYLVLFQSVLALDVVPHYNTLAKYGRASGVEDTMEAVFEATAAPFWLIEERISIDSTGLLLFGSGSWRANKQDDSPRDFAKLHVLSGHMTRATLAVRTTRGTWHDSTQVAPLIAKIPHYAVANAIAGDSAYWSRASCASARAAGLQPYFKPKSNALWRVTPHDDFERATRFALQFPNRFAEKYHERSTIESRNATDKGLFGERLRNRTPVSRRVEVFAREAVYNARLMTRWLPN